MTRSPGARSVVVTFVSLALAYGVWYAYSVFLVALLREFGWSRSLTAGAFSLFAAVHGVAGLPLGWLADRVGPRRIVLAGGAVLAAALLVDGAVTRPWHLYLGYGVFTSLGVAAAGWIPAVVLVQRWFPRRVGLALGAASSGIGVGIFLVVPLCQFLIDTWGWRWAFRVMAALVAVWVVPATYWLVQDPPAAGGGDSPERTMAPPAAGVDLTVGEAARTGRFWLLGTAQILGSGASQMLLVHQAAYLVDHGIAPMLAASVVSVVGLASIAGKTGGGWFSDQFGRELTYTLGMASLALAVGTLGLVALTSHPALAFVYGVLVGIGYSVTAPLLPAVISDLFRGRHFGAIFGTLHMANAIGGSLGPWAAGRVFDATGGYRPAFIGALGAAALATIGLWLVAPRRSRRAE
jgi:MFS family permease